MAEYAPQTLGDICRKIAAAIPTGRCVGVLGDGAHTYGYHRSRNWLNDHNPGDYSTTSARDRKGPGDAASAIDVRLAPAQMKTVTGRLMKAAKAKDRRLRVVREFFGTLNGRDVAGWDLLKHQASNGADDSHLWHVHVSIYRDSVSDKAGLDDLYAVMTGKGDLDMEPKQVRDAVVKMDGSIAAPKDAPDFATNQTWSLGNAIAAILWRVYHLPDAIRGVEALKTEQAAMRAQLDRIEAAVTGAQPPPPPAT